jgi:hypothetical protein
MAEAAELLGTSKDAVRMRVRRGSLRSEKGEDGRVYVYVEPDQDTVHAGSEGEASGELVAELRDRVGSLERELERAHERDRENRRIIAALTQRIPEIEAPPAEPPESPTAATEQSGRVEPQPQVEGVQEAAEPRSWWRRVFGS